jgi:hypothetical protein
MKHTKGPWYVSPEIKTGIYADTEDGTVYVCDMPEFVDWETRLANAKLIAAAPEMLEALEYIIAEKRLQGHEVWIEDRCLDEIIKKAKGE